MPKKSKKSKSKRQTLRHKYKVIRKVKEHARKVSKDAKKSGKKPKAPQDPGIPKQWPFKQELIQELEQKKALILEAEARKRQERKRAREEQRAAPADSDANMAERPSIEALQASARRREEEFATRKRARVADAGPSSAADSSRRAFYREFVKVVEASDVIIEVLDARDPLAYRSLEVERYVRAAGADKKIILLLNKIDLVPREVAERWLKYLREELPTVAFRCSTQGQATNLSQRSVPVGKGAAAKRAAAAAKAKDKTGAGSGGAGGGMLGGSACLGAETLLQLLKNYARNLDLKTAITVGIVGLPNVGKSSLINSLKRARVAAVGNTPGVTRAAQEVHLDKHVKLLDSPGIVFSAGSSPAAALRNCVKVEKLEDPALPVAEIVAKCPSQQLMAQYRIPAFADPEEFLQHVAAARGKLRPGGTYDLAAAARVVLTDWNDGRIRFYTEPPERSSGGHDAAAIVKDWSADFDADQALTRLADPLRQVYSSEQSTVIAGLQPLDGGEADFFAMQSAGEARVDLEALKDLDAAMAAADLGVNEGEVGADGEEDAMDEAEAASVPSEQPRPRSERQTEALYVEDGQFNPHLARSQKKKQKRAKRAKDGEGDEATDDYDFGVLEDVDDHVGATDMS